MTDWPMPSCDVCGQPVESAGDGSCWLLLSEIHTAEYEKWEEQLSESQNRMVDLATVHIPEPIHFYWGHGACEPSGTANSYPGIRFNGPVALLEFSAHIFEKRYFKLTDWPDFARKFARSFAPVLRER